MTFVKLRRTHVKLGGPYQDIDPTVSKDADADADADAGPGVRNVMGASASAGPAIK
jgi:hypothetical protein